MRGIVASAAEAAQARPATLSRRRRRRARPTSPVRERAGWPPRKWPGGAGAAHPAAGSRDGRTAPRLHTLGRKAPGCGRGSSPCSFHLPAICRTPMRRGRYCRWESCRRIRLGRVLGRCVGYSKLCLYIIGKLRLHSIAPYRPYHVANTGGAQISRPRPGRQPWIHERRAETHYLVAWSASSQCNRLIRVSLAAQRPLSKQGDDMQYRYKTALSMTLLALITAGCANQPASTSTAEPAAGAAPAGAEAAAAPEAATADATPAPAPADTAQAPAAATAEPAPAPASESLDDAKKRELTAKLLAMPPQTITTAIQQMAKHPRVRYLSRSGQYAYYVGGEFNAEYNPGKKLFTISSDSEQANVTCEYNTNGELVNNKKTAQTMKAECNELVSKLSDYLAH